MVAGGLLTEAAKTIPNKKQRFLSDSTRLFSYKHSSQARQWPPRAGPNGHRLLPTAASSTSCSFSSREEGVESKFAGIIGDLGVL